VSLLMEALKKAEQEKREAALRLREAEEQSETRADTESIAGLSPTSTEITGEFENDDSAGIAEPQPESDPLLTALQLTPEPVDEQYTETHSRAAPAAPVLDLDQKLEMDVDDIKRHEKHLQQAQRLQTEAPADDAPGLIKGIAGASVDPSTEDDPDWLETTLQGGGYESKDGSVSGDETLSDVSAVQMAKDIGGEDAPTPVAAQTIFTASGAAPMGSRFNWPLYAGLASIIVMAIAVVVYLSVTPVIRELPSPLVARGIERISAPTGNITPPPVPGTLIEVPDQGLTPSQEPSGDQAGGEQMQHTAGESGTEVQEQTDTDNIADATAVAAIPEKPPRRTGGFDVEGFTGDTDGGEQDILPMSIEVETRALRISRAKVTEEKSQVINDAYHAYQSGDMVNAKSKYAEALEAYPDNRDAMLGLAAVAMNEGDMASALAMYSYLVELYPQDALARAALIGLQQRRQSLQDEAAIRNMLFEQPTNPFLYFTLGKIYASQSRWPEAQQAFFDAYRFDSTRPGYALNLAISLDRLGQSQSALDYYHVAVNLAHESDAGFDTAAIARRISTLSHSVQP